MITPEKLEGEYLDVNEGVGLEKLYTTQFDENSDLGTTYLCKGNITWSGNIKAEEKFPTSEQAYTVGNY